MNEGSERGECVEEYVRLVGQAKKGNTDAFASLYEEVYEDMYRFALYTLGNIHDAEDVVSEAVMSAFASIRKLRMDEAFRGWIFKILSNKCKERIREYTKRNSSFEQEMNAADSAIQRNTACEDSAGWLAMQGLLRELEAEERIIICMHIFGGYKTREIAEILHMNENTVRSKESRALKKLAEKIKQ